MKNIIILNTLLLLIFSTQAQNFIVPANLPATKEEFLQSENDFINTAKWLENTPIGSDMETRTKANAYIIVWLTNSPTVTIELGKSILKIFDNNPQLMSVYMAGYARYVIENNYSKDKLKANTAGIKAAINCYHLGGEVKKNKTLNKAIDADKKNMLEDWVNEIMKD